MACVRRFSFLAACAVAICKKMDEWSVPAREFVDLAPYVLDLAAYVQLYLATTYLWHADDGLAI